MTHGKHYLLNGTTSKEQIKHSYNDFTYFLMSNIKFNPTNTMRIFINSMTENPSITRLQGIYDVSNAQFISRGNPDLSPSYTNRLNVHYINSDIENGRTFMAMAMVQNTSNYITQSTEHNKTIQVDNDGEIVTYNPLQYTTYTNLDGYWSAMGGINYGFPVGFLSSNLNLTLGVNYSETPTLIDQKKNVASTMGYLGGLVLGSNISQYVDFTLSWSGSYFESKNSLAQSGNANRYFNHIASADMKFYFLGGFTFTASAAYNQYVGYTNDYNESYMLCNAYVGHKLFKNQLGEIMVGVNDIFDQNTKTKLSQVKSINRICAELSDERLLWGLLWPVIRHGYLGFCEAHSELQQKSELYTGASGTNYGISVEEVAEEWESHAFAGYSGIDAEFYAVFADFGVLPEKNRYSMQQGELGAKIRKVLAGEQPPEFMIFTAEEEAWMLTLIAPEIATLKELYERMHTCACKLMTVHAPKSVEDQIAPILFQSLFFQTVGFIGNCAVLSGALEVPCVDGPVALYVRKNRKEDENAWKQECQM